MKQFFVCAVIVVGVFGSMLLSEQAFAAPCDAPARCLSSQALCESRGWLPTNYCDGENSGKICCEPPQNTCAGIGGVCQVSCDANQVDSKQDMRDCISATMNDFGKCCLPNPTAPVPTSPSLQTNPSPSVSTPPAQGTGGTTQPVGGTGGTTPGASAPTAAPTPSPGQGTAPANGTKTTGKGSTFVAYGLKNPLGTRTVPSVISAIIRWVSGLAGSLFFLYLLWGGAQWMLARGNGDDVKKAQQKILYAVVGVVVMMFSYFMVDALIDVTNVIP